MSSSHEPPIFMTFTLNTLLLTIGGSLYNQPPEITTVPVERQRDIDGQLIDIAYITEIANAAYAHDMLTSSESRVVRCPINNELRQQLDDGLLFPTDSPLLQEQPLILSFITDEGSGIALKADNGDEISLLSAVVNKKDNVSNVSMLVAVFSEDGQESYRFLPPIEFHQNTTGPQPGRLYIHIDETSDNIYFPNADMPYLQESIEYGLEFLHVVAGAMHEKADVADDDMYMVDPFPSDVEIMQMMAEFTGDDDERFEGGATMVADGDTPLDWLLREISLYALDETIITVTGTEDDTHLHLHVQMTDEGLQWDDADRHQLETYLASNGNSGITVRTTGEDATELRGYVWMVDEDNNQFWNKIAAEELVAVYDMYPGGRETDVEYC